MRTRRDTMSNSLYSTDYELLIRLLRELRLSLGITQAQMAARLGKTQAYVSKCERYERRIDVIELIHCCEALDVAPRHFIERFLDHRARLRPDADVTPDTAARSASGR
jgi:transcriptional regulator with XRE-family HTH domain